MNTLGFLGGELRREGLLALVWAHTDFDVHTGLLNSPFTMCKGTKDGEKREKRLWPLAENHELLSLYPSILMWNSRGSEKSIFSCSMGTSICTLALSPKNVMGGPIWSGLCRMSWHWQGKDRRNILSRGAQKKEDSEVERKNDRMMCLRTWRKPLPLGYGYSP